MVIDNSTTAFIAVSIPTMILLGLRHAMDVDHITAIDNMVRLHNASKKSRWVGAGFRYGTYDIGFVRDNLHNIHSR